MRTNITAHPAAITEFLSKNKCISSIGIKHYGPPIKEYIIDVIKNTIPLPNIQTITGKYVYISFLTPVLDVKVVEPVKFRERNAVIGGNINK